MDWLRAGASRQEFERFVTDCSGPLLRTAYLMAGNLAEAEDLVQEALLRVARRWPRVRAMEHPAAYARQILVNVALDGAAQRARRTGELAAADSAGIQDLADSRAAEVPGEAVERLQHRHYQPRTHGRVRLASAGLAGAAAVAAVLGIAMSQPASRSGSRPAQAQLAAWTVTRQADGTVDVTLRELRNPAALQSRLRADGVPAAVNIGGNPACQSYPPSATPALGQVFTFHPASRNEPG